MQYTLKYIKALVKYETEIPRKFYIESHKRPNTDTPSVMLDKWIQKFTKGKYGWGSCHLYQHQCRICNIIFWSEKKDDRQLCQRWRCYKKFYLGENHHAT